MREEEEINRKKKYTKQISKTKKSNGRKKRTKEEGTSTTVEKVPETEEN